jgi:hypothetical protein
MAEINKIEEIKVYISLWINSNQTSLLSVVPAEALTQSFKNGSPLEFPSKHNHGFGNSYLVVK